jgi:hypothetical protein
VPGFPPEAEFADIKDNEEMAIQEQQWQTDDVDQAILMLLGHRYGDGLVYLRNDTEEPLFYEAVRMGLVSSEGYVTPQGLNLLACHGDD